MSKVKKKLFSPLILAVFALVILSFSHYAEGSFISIVIETKTTVIGDTLKVGIKLTNRGDEPAFDVVASVDLNGDQQAGKAMESLGVNKSFLSAFNYELKLEKAGKYPLIVIVDYEDANMYPFSALSVPQFFYKESVSPGILCKSGKVEIAKRGEMRLTVKNLDEKRKDIRVRLVLSKELTVSNAIQNVDLLPHSEVDISFDVTNFSALSGSSYAGFAILEYDEDDKHFSFISPGVVKIVTEKIFVYKYKWVIIAAISLLLVVFVVLQFVKKKSET